MNYEFLTKALIMTANIGKIIADLRKEKGYTQRKLAAELGITQRMITYFENENPFSSKAICTT